MKSRVFLILSVCFCLSMILLLASCAKSRGPEDFEGEGRVWYCARRDKKVFKDYQSTLDPEEVYQKIPYSEPMLYGNYWLYNEDRAIKDFQKDASYQPLTYAEPFLEESVTETYSLSTLPCRVQAGPAALYYSCDVQKNRTQSWAILLFMREDGTCIDVTCAFTVEGNKVRYRPLSLYQRNYDEDFNLLGVNIELSDTVLEYEYRIRGPYLTLTRDGKSITLCSYNFSGNNRSDAELDGCLAPGSPSIEGVKAILSSSTIASAQFEYGDYSYDASLRDFSMKICENGIVVFYWTVPNASGDPVPHYREFVYFDCDSGAVFADQKNVYYYYESWSSIKDASLSEGFASEEAPAIADLSDTEKKDAFEKKTDLIGDLVNAFEDAGIQVRVDRTTGEIAVDSSVLFGGDSALLNEDGKAFLERFLPIYSSVVESEKYRGFVSRTVIEGHTAPLAGSTYESGLPLSEERASAVLDYCLSLDGSLAGKLTAVGCSNSKPVYNTEGEVDLVASRRVSFFFVVDLSSIRSGSN